MTFLECNFNVVTGFEAIAGAIGVNISVLKDTSDFVSKFVGKKLEYYFPPRCRFDWWIFTMRNRPPIIQAMDEIKFGTNIISRDFLINGLKL